VISSPQWPLETYQEDHGDKETVNKKEEVALSGPDQLKIRGHDCSRKVKELRASVCSGINRLPKVLTWRCDLK